MNHTASTNYRDLKPVPAWGLPNLLRQQDVTPESLRSLVFQIHIKSLWKQISLIDMAPIDSSTTHLNIFSLTSPGNAPEVYQGWFGQSWVKIQGLTSVLSHHADLRDSRDDEFVDEVILSAHFTEEEVDLLLLWDKSGADESGVCREHTQRRSEMLV